MEKGAARGAAARVTEFYEVPSTSQAVSTKKMVQPVVRIDFGKLTLIIRDADPTAVQEYVLEQLAQSC